jgi:hypothetical protein
VQALPECLRDTAFTDDRTGLAEAQLNKFISLMVFLTGVQGAGYDLHSPSRLQRRRDSGNREHSLLGPKASPAVAVFPLLA